MKKYHKYILLTSIIAILIIYAFKLYVGFMGKVIFSVVFVVACNSITNMCFNYFNEHSK